MKILIVGAGPAGVSAAETIREQNHQIEIEILSSEPYPPYSPPAMIDHFLHGSKAHFWKGQDWPERLEVRYRNGCEAAKINPDSATVSLANGERIPYDKLLIATGSRLYAPLEGSDLPGVYNFKSLSAAEQLVQEVTQKTARSALIVGAGFIGMEIALLLADLGVDVTQIEMQDQVMGRMLNDETAKVALDRMRDRGVKVLLNIKAAAFVGDDRARAVRLESGEIMEADLLIAATGVKPNLEWIAGSGIDHGWGITVDDRMKTNAENIYAAGDAVEVEDPLTGETFVHAIFPNAVEQGKTAGLNMLGLSIEYAGPKRMNSLKHLGIPIMVVGLKEGDEVLHSAKDGSLRTLYIQDHRLVGYQLVGDIRGAGLLHQFVSQKRDIRPFKDQLLAPTFGQGTVAWNALLPFG